MARPTNLRVPHFLVTAAVLLFSLTSVVQAQESQPGDACPGQTNMSHWSGGPETGGIGNLLLCNGTVWEPILRYASTSKLGVGTATTPTVTMALGGTDALLLTAGTTAQRPGAPLNGMIRYNSDSGKFEGYQGGAWLDILTGAATMSFLGLTDTPGTYAGTGGHFVRVNAGTTALEFTNQILESLSGLPPATGLALADLETVVIATPASGEVLQYDGTNWINASGAIASGADKQIQFNSGGSLSGSGDLIWDGTIQMLSVTGDINYTGRIVDISDQRMKNSITPLSTRGSMIERLSKVGTYSFSMKNDPLARIEFGVIAQELEPVFPELVTTGTDDAGTKAVNYSGLIPVLLEAIKEQQAQIDALKSEIETLQRQK